MKIYARKLYCEPLRCNPKNKDLIDKFTIDREPGDGIDEEGNISGLLGYLKYCAWDDDESGKTRIYVIKPYLRNIIVAYFGIKSGMVITSGEVLEERAKHAAKHGAALVSGVIPGIEISHFAVNDAYRNSFKNPPKRIGEYLYPTFIYPVIKKVSGLVGAEMIYLYAAGDEGLVKYYKDAFGFVKSNYINGDLVYPAKPKYDFDCHFMLRSIQ